MAIRVQIAVKGAERYLSVVQDYKDGARRKTRALQSFGPDTPEALARAHHYRGVCQGLVDFAETDSEDLVRVAMLVFGNALGEANVFHVINDAKPSTSRV